MHSTEPTMDPGYLDAIDRELEDTPRESASAPAPRDQLPQAIRALDAPDPEPVRWLVDDFWPAGEIGLLVGDGGTFKSSAALHIAAAVAGGYPVFERYAVPTRRPVLVVSAEDPQGVVLMRIEAFVAGHGWDRERVLANVHVLAEGDPSISGGRWRSHLAAEVKRTDAGFLVLDPWAEILSGDENSNTDARPAIKYLRALARANDTAIGIVHHAGKAGQDKRALDRIRGASALPSAARLILFFDYQADGVGVENLKMSRTARLEPFIVRREITSLPGNRAMWTTARLGVETQEENRRTKAEDWVLRQLRIAHPGRVNSRTLREFARGTPGIRNQDVGSALVTLPARGLIDYEPGPKAAKLWGLTRNGIDLRLEGDSRSEVALHPRGLAGDDAPSRGARAPTSTPEESQPSLELDRPNGPDLTVPKDSGHGWAHSSPDRAHRAQSVPGHGAGLSPTVPAPFRGGRGTVESPGSTRHPDAGTGHTGHTGHTPTDDSAEAEILAELGEEEGPG